MPTTYNFAYTVEKLHPYTTEGNHPAEAFDALRKALATEPHKMFNLGEVGIVFKEPQKGNSYLITLQE